MRKNRQDRKEELLDAIIAARREILLLMRQIPPEQQDEAFVGLWCAKDLLAHLIGWDHTNLQAVQEILDGKRPGFFQFRDKDWQSYNASLVSTYRREPFDALLEDAAASHERLLDFLRALPPDVVLEGKYKGEAGRTVTIRRLLRAEAADNVAHSAQVREFLKQIQDKTM